MKIAIIADSHFDESSRFEECIRLHGWIADDMKARGVEVILHAGDVFERKSTPKERAALADWLRKCAELAPVVIVRGNHDALGDLAIFEKLRTKHPIIVEEAVGVHVVNGVAIAALAWPRKAELLARVDSSTGHAESEAIAGDAMRNVLRGLGMQLSDHDGPTVLLAHAMVRGSVTSLGQPLVGCDLEIGLEDLSLVRAGLVALGHIHKGQDWTFGDMPIVYPGSPRRTAFGELEEKAYVVATFDGSKLAGWERVVVPATPMLLLEDQWGDREDGSDMGWLCGLHGFDGEDSVRGAEIRFRYRVESDRRDAARAASEVVRRKLLSMGALSIRVEEVVDATTRARAPEIAEVTTLADKLPILWRSKGIEVSPERQSKLFSKLAEVDHAL